MNSTYALLQSDEWWIDSALSTDKKARFEVNYLYPGIQAGVDMTKIERESINFKLPKPLTAALRAKARELDTTATDLVIQGLHHVLSKAYDHVDTCADVGSRTN